MQEADICSSRFAHTVTVAEDKIYVFGGVDFEKVMMTRWLLLFQQLGMHHAT
jgi:hypothetical protein